MKSEAAKERTYCNSEREHELTRKLDHHAFEARGLARSRYHTRLFQQGRPRPSNEEFDEGFDAGYEAARPAPALELLTFDHLRTKINEAEVGDFELGRVLTAVRKIVRHASPAPADDEITCDGVFHYSPTPEHCGHEGQPCPLTIASASADEEVCECGHPRAWHGIGEGMGVRGACFTPSEPGGHLCKCSDYKPLIAAVLDEKETK